MKLSANTSLKPPTRDPACREALGWPCHSSTRARLLNIMPSVRTCSLYIVLLAVAFLSSGCQSTKCMVSTKHLHRFDGGVRPVYVTNPTMQHEYEILTASGIYQLTNQPEGSRKLTLLPLRHYPRCQNPLMLTIMTFGIVPGVLPGNYVFEYDLDTDGVVQHCQHPLPIYERFSIWEWLVRHHDQKILAKALAWSSPRQPPNESN